MEQSESATGYAPDGGADGSASSSGRAMKAAKAADPVSGGDCGTPRGVLGRTGAGPLDKLASFLEVQRKDMVPMFEMCLLMFLWGLANNLNDILIKQFKKAFELGNLQAGLVQSAFYIGYFVGAPFASMVANKFDYKRSIICGLGLYALGAALFYPAAATQVYALFLGALLIIGFGLAFLETSVSPYLIRFGPAETAARRINFAAVWNPCGSLAGIFGGRVLVFSGVEWTSCSCPEVELNAQSCGLFVHLGEKSAPPCAEGSVEAGCFVTPGSSPGQETAAVRACDISQVEEWRADAAMATQLPYMVVAASVALSAVLVWQTVFPQYADPDAADAMGAASQQSFSVQATAWVSTTWRLLAVKRFRNGVLAQFMYVGGQVGTWSYLIQYVQANVPDTSEKTGADYVFWSLVMLTLGRAASTVLLRWTSDCQLMLYYGVINIGLCLVGVLVGGSVGTMALVVTSFFMSLMFPTIFTIAIRGLNKEETQLGSSLIVMSIIGGAVLTPCMGLLADNVGINSAYVVPMVAFVAVTAYAKLELEGSGAADADAGQELSSERLE